MPIPWLVGLRSDDEGSPCPVVNATFDFRESRSRIRADVIASSPLKTDSKWSVLARMASAESGSNISWAGTTDEFGVGSLAVLDQDASYPHHRHVRRSPRQILGASAARYTD